MDHKKEFDEGRLGTTSGDTPKHFGSPAPDPDVISTGSAAGQHKDYWVLSPSERAKGFVRPVRRAYRHVGIPGPTYPLRDLTPEEKERHAASNYSKYEDYQGERDSIVGRFWTEEQLARVGRGCKSVTTMSASIAETYAREPRFYGSTFCVNCGTHLPVGEDGEFVWDGLSERVGT